MRPGCGIIIVLVAALLAGCDEQTGLPLAAVVDGDVPTRWTTLFPRNPDLTPYHLEAPHADELWVGYGRGFLQHWDGERSTWHELPSGSTIEDLHALDDGDCWALSYRSLWHWDGRTWSEGPSVNDPLDAHCLWVGADGTLLVGGEHEVADRPMVARWTGSAWKAEILPAPDGVVTDLWRTHDGGPLLAQIHSGSRPSAVAWLTDDGWEPVMAGTPVWAASGSLLVADSDSVAWLGESLFRVGRGPRIEPVCGALNLAQYGVLDFDVPLTVAPGSLVEIRNCQQSYTHTLLYLDTSRLEVAASPHDPPAAIFGRDRDGNIYRVMRQADRRLVETLVIPAEPLAIESHLTVQDGRIFGLQDGELVVGAVTDDPAAWRREADAGDGIESIEPATGGGLQAIARDDHDQWQFGWRSPAGAWSWTEPLATDRSIVNAWRDPQTGDHYVMTDESRFRVHRGGQWLDLDQLGRSCWSYGALSAQRQYAIVRMEDEDLHLAAYDGQVWRPAAPDSVRNPDQLLCLPNRDALLLDTQVVDEDSGDTRYVLLELRGQQWRRLLDQNVWLADVFEDSAGLIYRQTSNRLYRLEPTGWKTVFDRSDDPTYPGINAHDYSYDHQDGLFVLDWTNRVHHRARRD